MKMNMHKNPYTSKYASYKAEAYLALIWRRFHQVPAPNPTAMVSRAPRPTLCHMVGGRDLHQIQEVFHVHDDHSVLITPKYSDFTKPHSTISYFLEFQFLDSSDSDYSHIYGRLPIPTRGVRKFPTKPLFLRCLFFFQVIFSALFWEKSIHTVMAWIQRLVAYFSKQLL